MKKEITKASILKSFAKMAEDKEAVRSYMKGKTSLQSLQERGIKFAEPI